MLQPSMQQQQQQTHRDYITARSRSRAAHGPLNIAIHARFFVLLEHPTAGSATIVLVGITYIDGLVTASLLTIKFPFKRMRGSSLYLAEQLHWQTQLSLLFHVYHHMHIIMPLSRWMLYCSCASISTFISTRSFLS